MTSENKLNNAKVTQSDPPELQLFPHNKKAYLAVQEAFSSGMLRCCVVHPTGTGKAYIALSVIRDHPDATILYVTSTVANMEYFYHLVEDSLHIDLPDSMILMTIYQNLGQKISSFDYIILDEFHRAGAPTWSKYVHDLIAQNPEAKVLGLSATPIRYLDDYRNMAEDLFDGNVVSEITLQDAIVEGLLPAPRYVTSLYSYKETADQIENVLNTPGAVRDPSEARRILSIVRRIIETIGGVDQLLKEHIPCTPGKYIVFCKNLTHLLSLSQVIPDWFAFTGLPVKLYRLHSGNPNTDVLSAFENDPAPGIQILLCINMLNEGIHLSHLSGIILARPTESPIIYFQQIGRALSVSSKGTPLIIDLVDNINQINMSKGFWNGVLNDMQRKDMPITGIFNVFGREFELLEYLNQFEKYVWSNWDCYYEICRKYYVDHGDLNIPSNYIVDGHYIASWLSRQRRCYNGLESPMLSEDQITRLNQIGMAWSCPRKNTWEENYSIARQYYEEYHDLLPPRHFIYHGLHLWAWLSVVRSRYNAGNLSEDKISLLNEIGMVWKLSTSRPWAEAFQVLLQFKETNGHCNVPVDYVIDGFNLYHWCLRQRHAHTMGTLPEGRMIQLESIGFVWKQRKTFAEMYEIAREFYMEHGHLLPHPNQFYHGVNLGHWLIIQRYRKSSTRDNRLKEEQVKQLDEIGMYWHTQTIRNHARWMKHFENASAYYTEHHTLTVPRNTIYNGDNLSNWIALQRARNRNTRGTAPLEPWQIEKLDSIGMIWDGTTVWADEKWTKNCECLKHYKELHHSLLIPKNTIFEGINISSWLILQRKKFRQGKLAVWKIDQLNAIDAAWLNADRSDEIWRPYFAALERYYLKHGHIDIDRNTNFDDLPLGRWLYYRKCDYRNNKLKLKYIEILDHYGIKWLKKRSSKKE